MNPLTQHAILGLEFTERGHLPSKIRAGPCRKISAAEVPTENATMANLEQSALHNHNKYCHFLRRVALPSYLLFYYLVAHILRLSLLNLYTHNLRRPPVWSRVGVAPFLSHSPWSVRTLFCTLLLNTPRKVHDPYSWQRSHSHCRSKGTATGGTGGSDAVIGARSTTSRRLLWRKTHHQTPIGKQT